MNRLDTWKDSRRRKPLVLKGARQTGKTWLLKEFGATRYANLAYLPPMSASLKYMPRALDSAFPNTVVVETTSPAMAPKAHVPRWLESPVRPQGPRSEATSHKPRLAFLFVLCLCTYN